MASRTEASLRRQGYHHGNLREALVAAARGLIAERGPAGFTLVEAARMAGVSPAAPYRHFKDRDALVAEIRRRGFEEFARRMIAAGAGAGHGPQEGFERMGNAYLAFAREEPGYYGAMFMPGPATTAPAGSNADVVTFGALEAAVGRINGAGAGEGGEQRRLAFLVWALSHGIATLWAAGFPPSEEGATPEDLLRSGVMNLIRGAGIGFPATVREPAKATAAPRHRQPAKSKRVPRS